MRKTDPFNLLKLLYTSGPLSRTDLAKREGVAASYVSAVVSRAQAGGLISEFGLLESARGRRKVLLNINPDLAQLVGVDIGRRHLRIAITDFSARILDYVCLESGASQGKDHALSTIDDALKILFSSRPELAGIGISHSGVIDQQQGKVLFWPQFDGWEDVPLKHIFEQKYGLPTCVEDEVRAMATMEHRLGHGKDVRNFVFVYVGMGIGSAIFVDGRLYTGRDGLAGELGHTTVEKDGRLCSCGNRGCLELYSSVSAIIGRVRTELEQGVSSTLTHELGGSPETLSVEKIEAAAESHDRLAERVLLEAGAWLGTALAGVVNLLNPEKDHLGRESTSVGAWNFPHLLTL